MPLQPQSAVSQGTCPNSLFFRCFQFRFTFESIKELGNASNRLKTIATWIPLISHLNFLHNYHVIIQALNTTSLRQHYEDINHDHNLQMFYILCVIKTRIHHTSIVVHKFINSSKYSYISIHDGHGLMMMYDIHMHLDSFNIITSDGS